MNGLNPDSIAAHDEQPNPRAFTVTALRRVAHGGIGRCAPVPYLRMSGQWLEQYGFHMGCRVAVTAENGRLVLTLAGDASGEMDADVPAPHSFERRSR